VTFQKKCMGKMGDVARAGRTVVLVSHNMNAILTLCTRAVMLDGGRIVEDGGRQTLPAFTSLKRWVLRRLRLTFGAPGGPVQVRLNFPLFP